MCVFFTTTAYADDDRFSQKSIPTAKPGANVNVAFQVTEMSMPTTYFKIHCDNPFETDYDEEITEDVYPFENIDSSIATLREFSTPKEDTRSITISGLRVKKSLPDGYYTFYVSECNQDGHIINKNWFKLRIYVKAGSSGNNDKPEVQSTGIFAVGENQNAPYGKYPQVMNFAINLRNCSKIAVQDVTASIECDADTEKFPFEINEANYDRHFDLISVGEIVQVPYSFAIRKEAYSGFYPIKLKMSYRESSAGELLTDEAQFFVHIDNKEREDNAGEFNANNRVKARIIVEGFKTIPENVFAGQDFTLIINMKNASSNIDASNILFSFESEKASDSPVFTTAEGSGAVVVDSLKAGETATLEMNMTAKAGVDQRAYGLSIHEQYDSPEFKNAEEKVSVDIPVYEVAKYNKGNVEIMPESISVGDETNVMFPINNTGKVILYNVMVRFEGESIQTNETYIGNIKPGETGNVDVMLRGTAPTSDDGDIDVIVSYENEYGEVTESKESINIFVSENFDDYPIEDFDIEESVPEKKSVFATPWPYVGIGVLALAAGVLIVRIRKKRKEEINLDEETDEVN